MGFIFSGIFWGAVLILLGVGIVLNIAFGIRIPVFRIILALILLYLGISLLVGRWLWRSGARTTAFGEKRIEAVTARDKYDVLFGQSFIDLSNVTLKPGVNKVEVNAVFGSATVKVNRALPTKIKVSAAFAGARLPDGTSIVLGDHTYRSDSLKEDQPYLYLVASAVFGAIEVVDR